MLVLFAVDDTMGCMAIWQHDYYLFPRSKLIEHYGTVPELLPDDDWDAVDWWADAPFPDKTAIEQILPQGTSWSPDIDMWGANSETSLQVAYDKERQRIELVTIRFDLRTEYQPLRQLVHKIIELTARNEWVFCSQDTHQIMSPDYQVIATDMQLSQAQNYVSDPVSEIIDEQLRSSGYREGENQVPLRFPLRPKTEDQENDQE